MMPRSAGRLAGMLREYASSRYPTRTVESFAAWIMVVWSYGVIADPAMLTARAGNVYAPMLQLMPPLAWGWTGMLIGAARIAALIGNGHFRPSPELRLAGAAWGMMFWSALALG
jgi:hypothetical protein